MILASLTGKIGICAMIWLAAAVARGAEGDFVREIEPILRQRCVKCHGATVQLGRLNLSTREGLQAGGEHGAAVVAGNPEASRLYRLVKGHEKPGMPLDGKLSDQEIAAIAKWIERGAPWGGTAVIAAEVSVEKKTSLPNKAREWWAFRKPVRPPVPANAHPVDALLARHRGDLPVAPPAPREKLARRAYLDMTGLPPSPTELSAFLEDKKPGAWERLIERLLASPHYGERWGRHWLDVARYADSSGYEHDYDRPNAWRYRDYVIASFQADKPYDRFLAEQLAGDELPGVTPETLTATGFLRNHAKVNYREKDNPEFRYEYLDDMIATIGRGVMGLTVQCARCHDHKFDPILQRDYYRMQASLFGYVEVDHPLEPDHGRIEANRKLDEQIAAIRKQIREVEQPYRDRLLPLKYAKYPEAVREAIRTPEEKRTAGQKLLANQVIRTTSVSGAEVDRVASVADQTRKKVLLGQIAALERQRPPAIATAMGITDGDYRSAPDGPGDEPAPGKGKAADPDAGPFLHQGPGPYQVPPSYLLIRGDVHSRGERMEPGFPEVLLDAKVETALPPADGRTSGRRLALARWLGSPANPLTARVLVNRVWHHHFGGGIVRSIDNFGKMGDLPSNPELLDYLAVEFMEQGWSIKKLHRLILTSAAYQRDSSFDDARSAAKDPRNETLWRYPVHRLEAEAVRDSILAAAGTLNRETGGPAVFPVLEPEELRAMTHGIWNQTVDGPPVWRRSVYIYRKRGLPFPLLEAFDLPDQNVSCGARNTSTVPTQALTLLNNKFVLDHARHLARLLEEARPGDRKGQIELGYLRTLGRVPRPEEAREAEAFLASEPLEGLAHVLLNLNEFLYIQ